MREPWFTVMIASLGCLIVAVVVLVAAVLQAVADVRRGVAERVERERHAAFAAGYRAGRHARHRLRNQPPWVGPCGGRQSDRLQGFGPVADHEWKLSVDTQPHGAAGPKDNHAR